MRDVVMAGILLAAAGAAMQLQSGDIPAGGAIAQVFMASDCGGTNRSPALAWSSPPKDARSFALVVHDADAPIAGGFYHWVVYDLPAASRGLSAGAKLESSQLGDTSLGKPGYYGPCPPPGPAHHYTFTLYALDLARISTGSALTGAQLEARIAGHVLARATLAATASRH